MKTPRPFPPPFFPDQIPLILTSLDHWTLWRYSFKGTKWTKVPYQSNGECSRSNDPSTWSGFELCRETLEGNHWNGFHGYDGIGFFVAKGDNLVGIDMDHCMQSNGQVDAWTAEIIDRFSDTYRELTPSGNGLRIWCLGRPVQTGQVTPRHDDEDRGQRLEVYAHPSNRFFTVTGDRINGNDIAECPGALEWLHERFWPKAENRTRAKSNRTYQRSPDADKQQILDALKVIPPGVGYADWIRIGMALKSSGFGVGTWDSWSSQSTKYQSGECERKWRSF